MSCWRCITRGAGHSGVLDGRLDAPRASPQAGLPRQALTLPLTLPLPLPHHHPTPHPQAVVDLNSPAWEAAVLVGFLLLFRVAVYYALRTKTQR